MNRVRVGLIGTGRLGWMYAELLRTQIPNAQLVAIAGHRAKEIANQWEIGIWSEDRKAVINNEFVEAVVIVSNTGTHVEFIQEAVAARKPVLCEKPLALNSKGLDSIAQQIEYNEDYVQIGFMRRYDPGISEMKRLFRSGKIGYPVLFKSTSRDMELPSFEYCKTSGGLILDMGIHDLDLARYFFGEVKSIRTIGGVNVYDELFEINDIDNAIMSIEFRNGSLGVIDVSRCAYYGYDVHTEILGSQGALRAGYYPHTPVVHLDKNSMSHDIVPGFHERYREAFKIQLEDFVHRVQEGLGSPCTFKDGLKALRLAEFANKSLHTGLKVEVHD